MKLELVVVDPDLGRLHRRPLVADGFCAACPPPPGVVPDAASTALLRHLFDEFFTARPPKKESGTNRGRRGDAE